MGTINQCDRCRVPYKDEQQRQYRLLAIRPVTADVEFDLCPSCYEKLKEFLKPNGEKKWIP